MPDFSTMANAGPAANAWLKERYPTVEWKLDAFTQESAATVAHAVDATLKQHPELTSIIQQVVVESRPRVLAYPNLV